MGVMRLDRRDLLGSVAACLAGSDEDAAFDHAIDQRPDIEKFGDQGLMIVRAVRVARIDTMRPEPAMLRASDDDFAALLDDQIEDFIISVRSEHGERLRNSAVQRGRRCIP